MGDSDHCSVIFSNFFCCMSKVKATKCYHKNRKHLKAWEFEFTWSCSPPESSLVNNKDKKDFSYCKVCDLIVNPHRSNLARHDKSELHRIKLNLSSLTSSIKSFCQPQQESVSIKVKKWELQLAVYAAYQFSTITIDRSLI